MLKRPLFFSTVTASGTPKQHWIDYCVREMLSLWLLNPWYTNVSYLYVSVHSDTLLPFEQQRRHWPQKTPCVQSKWVTVNNVRVFKPHSIKVSWPWFWKETKIPIYTHQNNLTSKVNELMWLKLFRFCLKCYPFPFSFKLVII